MTTLKEIINLNSTRYSKTENVLSENDAIESVREWLLQKRQEQCARRSFIMILKVDMIDDLLEELNQP